jgi:hypothetical protein
MSQELRRHLDAAIQEANELRQQLASARREIERCYQNACGALSNCRDPGADFTTDPVAILSILAPQLHAEAQGLRCEVENLSAEVKRLREGDFTEAEFQNLCHNLKVDGRPVTAADVCRFSDGCTGYQRKLFGAELVNAAYKMQTDALMAELLRAAEGTGATVVESGLNAKCGTCRHRDGKQQWCLLPVGHAGEHKYQEPARFNKIVPPSSKRCAVIDREWRRCIHPEGHADDHQWEDIPQK